jgi:chemotaxis signal transduction protein
MSALRKEPAPSAAVISLLERRAERLKQPVEEELPADSQAWIAELPLGEDSYGIPLEQLRGATRGSRVTPVPLAPPEVIGLFRFRGELYTALSLPALLGGAPTRHTPSIVLIVEYGDGQGIGLGCDEIPRLIGVPDRAISDLRQPGAPPVRSVPVPGRRPLNVVNLSRLLAEAEVPRAW